jgi:hypothetical protein
MATKDAFGAGFKPSEATIDAGNLDRGEAYAFHHAIHQLRATKIPNKRRLPTAKSAHLTPPSCRSPSEPLALILNYASATQTHRRTKCHDQCGLLKHH